MMPASGSPLHVVPDDKKATEHLANERTFLAWVRTSIAIISLGFVIAKFGVWLERMAQLAPAASNASIHSHPLGWSTPVGAGMMILGAVLTVLAAWHHQRTTLQIEAGKVEPARWLVLLVSSLVGLLVTVMVIYLLLSTR